MDKKKKKLLIAGIGIGVAGAGYFGWQYYQKKQMQKHRQDAFDDLLPALQTSAVSTSSSPPVVTYRNDKFPLKKGSKGQRVKQLQQALIGKYGKNILPKYGADGDFGSETKNALSSKGLPTVIDEKTFDFLVKTSGSPNAAELAKKFHSAASQGDFNSVLSALKQMNSTSDYTAVSNIFKQSRFRGVHQTLVNGLLSSFTGNNKQKIQLEFLRMGLKYNGSQWSLSGIPVRKVITIQPTVVWDEQKHAIEVPANKLLGFEVTCRNGYCMFRTINNKLLITHLKTIKKL